MNKKYKLNKEWLDLMLENKNNTNLTFNLSDNDTRILLTYIEVLQQENSRLKDKIDKAIEYIKNASYFDGSGMCANDLLAILGDKENE